MFFISKIICNDIWTRGCRFQISPSLDLGEKQALTKRTLYLILFNLSIVTKMQIGAHTQLFKKELKMQNRYRNNQVHLDLSDDELALLNAKLRESKMKSKMEFLRHLILFSDIYVVDYKELQEYNFLLSNFTNNLNQIARVANSTGCIGADDINKAVKLTEEVWRLQKSMLSKLQFRQP